MGCETGVSPPGMCTPKSSVLSRALRLVWRRLGTLLIYRKGRPDPAPQSHSRVAGLPRLGIRNSRACSNWRKRATFPPGGRAGLESHTCMTGLISGSIVYNPEPLERPAPGNVLVCCSQPNAEVTLDL